MTNPEPEKLTTTMKFLLGMASTVLGSLILAGIFAIGTTYVKAEKNTVKVSDHSERIKTLEIKVNDAILTTARDVAEIKATIKKP